MHFVCRRLLFLPHGVASLCNLSVRLRYNPFPPRMGLRSRTYFTSLTFFLSVFFPLSHCIALVMATRYAREGLVFLLYPPVPPNRGFPHRTDMCTLVRILRERARESKEVYHNGTKIIKKMIFLGSRRMLGYKTPLV